MINEYYYECKDWAMENVSLDFDFCREALVSCGLSGNVKCHIFHVCCSSRDCCEVNGIPE